jgi:hypothetical protein
MDACWQHGKTVRIPIDAFWQRFDKRVTYPLVFTHEYKISTLGLQRGRRSRSHQENAYPCARPRVAQPHMTRSHASPFDGEDSDGSLLAICRRDMPERRLLEPAPEVEEPASEPCSPLARCEGPCGVEDDAEEEFDHAAALVELLAIGTRVICRPMTLATPLVANSWEGTHSHPDLTLEVCGV